LVNETGVSIHHVVNAARFFPVAFIFDERTAAMVNRWFAARGELAAASSARELHVKPGRYKGH
jgi:hypothetical protein